MNYKIIIGSILAGMAGLFIVQNFSAVALTFLFWTLSIPIALLIFLIVSIGMILGWLLHGGVHRRKDNSYAKRAIVSDRPNF